MERHMELRFSFGHLGISVLSLVFLPWESISYHLSLMSHVLCFHCLPKTQQTGQVHSADQSLLHKGILCTACALLRELEGAVPAVWGSQDQCSYPLVLLSSAFLFPVLINVITCFDFSKCKIINSLNQHNQQGFCTTLWCSARPSVQCQFSPLPDKTTWGMDWVPWNSRWGFYDWPHWKQISKIMSLILWEYLHIFYDYPLILLFTSYQFDSTCLFFRPLWVLYLVYCFQSTRHSNALFAYANVMFPCANDNKSKNYEHKW